MNAWQKFVAGFVSTMTGLATVVLVFVLLGGEATMYKFSTGIFVCSSIIALLAGVAIHSVMQKHYESSLKMEMPYTARRRRIKAIFFSICTIAVYLFARVHFDDWLSSDFFGSGENNFFYKHWFSYYLRFPMCLGMSLLVSWILWRAVRSIPSLRDLTELSKKEKQAFRIANEKHIELQSLDTRLRRRQRSAEKKKLPDEAVNILLKAGRTNSEGRKYEDNSLVITEDRKGEYTVQATGKNVLVFRKIWDQAYDSSGPARTHYYPDGSGGYEVTRSSPVSVSDVFKGYAVTEYSPGSWEHYLITLSRQTSRDAKFQAVEAQLKNAGKKESEQIESLKRKLNE